MLQKYDPRNADIQVFIGDRLFPREEAKVSVFDSTVQGGDAVWEGLRVYEEGLFCLDEHLQRLQDSAHALLFEDIPSKDLVRKAIQKTLEANGMNTDVHIRLTLSRGEKVTSGMDSRLNQKGSTLIVLAEWKAPVFDNAKGIDIITSSIRRNGPSFLDSRIHHNNLLNNILAKIQANVAGVDAALMLDEQGFVAELNDTNVFILKNGGLLTPPADACLPGITRSKVMALAQELDIPCIEKRITVVDCYTADGMFATGTMGELTPIVLLDGRAISNAQQSEPFQRVQAAYTESRSRWCTSIESL